MTLYDIIMGNLSGFFTKKDWSNLGKGEVEDEDTIKKMLSAGYEGIVDED